MKSDRQRNLQDLLVFFLLVAIGVAGRWGQPTWCFTPTAAAALFAGYVFLAGRDRRCMVPIAILAISDLLLPAYNNHSGADRDVRDHDGARLSSAGCSAVSSRAGERPRSGHCLDSAGDAVLHRDELRRLGVSERL